MKAKTVPASAIESIEFDHVWFSYENNDVYALQDFTLHIKAGDFTGIVGPSGSGKYNN